MNKKLKKLILAAATLLASASMTATALAWGPERSTYTMQDPADHPTFNSITDNPTIGDERNFVRVGEINADLTDLQDEVEVVPGKQYLVYIYFHNDASSIYNYSEYNHSGIALNTRMSSSFTKVITPDQKGTITATITADNTDPTSVWDEAYLTTSTKKVLLSYVEGSAKIYNDFATNGSILSTNLFTEAGTLIGLTGLDGAIPGCEQYHGTVTYVLEAKELGGTVEKSVSKDGDTFTQTLNADEGDELTYKLTIKNTGDVALTNATIKDNLPQGLTLVEGSVELWANDSTTKDKLSDAIATNGYNLTTIGTSNVVYITYKATVGKDFDCNGYNLDNTAILTYDSETSTGDTDTATSSVTVVNDKAACALPDSIVSTGPAEIVMAVVIILGIAGGAFYLYRTRRTLKTVETDLTSTPSDASSGPTATEDSSSLKDDQGTTPENPTKE